jgi:type I restriction enzyme R subunit
VINYLVKNGVMEPNAMFHTPFTNSNDQGVLGVFGEQGSRKIIETLRQINRNADVT